MDIEIQGLNNFTVSDRMKEYLLKRIKKLNYFEKFIENINFHLYLEKYVYKVSSVMRVRKLDLYKFETKAKDMYTAIDKIIHKMDVKMGKEKSRLQKHHKQGIRGFFNSSIKNEEFLPEPTKNIKLLKKPSTLADAYLELKLSNQEFFGFSFLHEDNNIKSAFLRRVKEDVVSLFRSNEENSYDEYSLKIFDKDVMENKKLKNIVLSKMNLFDAQQKILNQNLYFDMYIDSNNKTCLLYTVGNRKWNLIS